jgi:GR25 family glycosyltransferase involved in LPS biosynthesis
MSFIDYFDRTAIINLPERSDRRTETGNEFKRAGWSIDNDKSGFFPAIKPQDPAGFPSAGVRGCFLSHLNVIKQARHDNLDNVLVMEDDIAFVPAVESIGAEIILELKQTPWDFLYLGHEHTSAVTSGKRLEKITEPLLLAHCYAVNSTVFDRFLEFLEQVLQRPPGHPEGGPMHYDGAISTFRMQNTDVKTFVAIPSIGYQRSSRTDLHPLTIWDRWALLRPFMETVRRMKNIVRRSAL